MTMRLLVVDDDPFTAELLTRLGKVANFDTRAITDPEAFRRMLSSFDPTAVVLDIVMPVEDGISLLRHLSTALRRVPVILVSAYSHTYLPAAKRLGEAYGLHVAGTLAKPINPEAFRAALRRAEAAYA